VVVFALTVRPPFYDSARVTRTGKYRGLRTGYDYASYGKLSRLPLFVLVFVLTAWHPFYDSARVTRTGKYRGLRTGYDYASYGKLSRLALFVYGLHSTIAPV
jgi:hypothetical protein